MVGVCACEKKIFKEVLKGTLIGGDKNERH